MGLDGIERVVAKARGQVGMYDSAISDEPVSASPKATKHKRNESHSNYGHGGDPNVR